MPYKAMDDPQRMKLRRDIEEPRVAKSSTLKDEPIRVNPKTDNDDPRRIKPRSAKADPKWRKSMTLSDEPRLTSP
jgi:hypothetical protein